MTQTLYIIGTGPGDPEFLTLKAVRILNECPLIAAPKASQDGNSTALTIIAGAIDLSGKEIHELYFPMKKVRLAAKPAQELEEAWEAAAQTILQLLATGRDVAFPTLGDPAIYSTGYYLYDTLLSLQPDVQVRFIPGIAAMSSCSAATARPLCLGDDRLVVIPATFSEGQIRQALRDYDTIVLMKVHRVMDRICRLLAESGLQANAIYVERAGMAEERIIDGLFTAPTNPHYFSTIIVRKNGNGPSLSQILPSRAGLTAEQAPVLRAGQAVFI